MHVVRERGGKIRALSCGRWLFISSSAFPSPRGPAASSHSYLLHLKVSGEGHDRMRCHVEQMM